MSAPLLEAENLTKIFSVGRGFRSKHIRAVDGFSLSIPQERSVTINIVGESGCGKSTIARMLLGLIKPTSGEVRYKGKDIFKLSKKDRYSYRKDVQMVFQDPYGIYNPHYRINRIFDLTIKKSRLASSESEARNLINEAIESIGLRPSDILGRYPHQLSGGERQRVMLSRLWMIKPKVIVSDEPVSMIDASLRAVFLNALLNFKKEYSTSNIFITHNLALSDYLGGYMIVIYQGRVVEEGPVERIVVNPAHPYTKLLLRCLPTSDPDRRWEDELALKVGSIAKSSKALKTERGCAFYPRCPDSLEICRDHNPKITAIKDQKVACHLYNH